MQTKSAEKIEFDAADGWCSAIPVTYEIEIPEEVFIAGLARKATIK